MTQKSYEYTSFICSIVNTLISTPNLSFLLQNIVFHNLFLGFVTERVYQNNTVAIPHLIEYVVTTRRMHKHQDVVVKHLESSS